MVHKHVSSRMKVIRILAFSCCALYVMLAACGASIVAVIYCTCLYRTYGEPFKTWRADVKAIVTKIYTDQWHEVKLTWKKLK